MSLGKRCHGQAMTSGWSTGTPDSSSDFDPDACNICPEVWPANSFKWCYTREQIEEMVFKAMVPSARAASNEVMGLRTSLPPMVSHFRRGNRTEILGWNQAACSFHVEAVHRILRYD